MPVERQGLTAKSSPGTGVLFSRPPDDDTDPRLVPGALIDEVRAIVSGCGRIGYRSLS